MTVAEVAPSSSRRSSACWILLGSAGCFLALALAVLLVDPFPGDAAMRRWVLGYRLFVHCRVEGAVPALDRNLGQGGPILHA